MIVLNQNNATHSIGILPRYYAAMTTDVSVEITNEDTRQDVTHNVSNVEKSDGFLIFDTDVSLIKNSTYRLKITDLNLKEVIFRGKIFSTDQSTQNYSLNG